VLDTVAESTARKLGLRPADIILELGGMPVDSGFELSQAISYAAEEFTINIDRDGKLLPKRGKFMAGERRLGVILVPSGHEEHYAQLTPARFGLADWLKGRWRSRNRH